jgi:hypothetical protein
MKSLRLTVGSLATGAEKREIPSRTARNPLNNLFANGVARFASPCDTRSDMPMLPRYPYAKTDVVLIVEENSKCRFANGYLTAKEDSFAGGTMCFP